MKNKSYYYTPEEWARSVGYGVVPDERNADLLKLTESELIDKVNQFIREKNQQQKG